MGPKISRASQSAPIACWLSDMPLSVREGSGGFQVDR